MEIIIAIAMAIAIKATPVLHFLLQILLKARFIKPMGHLPTGRTIAALIFISY
jgi:hypothetical protein